MTTPDDVIPPRLRGVLHFYALWCALLAVAALVLLAPDGKARTAALIYGAGLAALFAASALYHRWPGNPRYKPLLRRLDHSTIYVFIAASTTPAALLVLDSPLSAIVLVTAWAGALIGVAFALCWIEAPRWLVALTYLAVGWAGVMAFPALFDQLGVAPTALLVAGGLLYTLGALVYAAKRPDPWPTTFGFHEVFHALVILAAVAHFVAIAGWVIPSAA
jgi:hemolysin III